MPNRFKNRSDFPKSKPAARKIKIEPGAPVRCSAKLEDGKLCNSILFREVHAKTLHYLASPIIGQEMPIGANIVTSKFFCLGCGREMTRDEIKAQYGMKGGKGDNGQKGVGSGLV